jgi:hypothetical protein
MINLQPAPKQYDQKDQNELRRKLERALRDIERRLRDLESA